MISGVKTGSFGFQLEEIREQEPLVDPSSLQDALDEIVEFFEVCRGKDLSTVEEQMGTMHKTSLRNIYKFLETLKSAGAYFDIDSGNKQASFQNLVEIEDSLEFLGKNRIDQQDEVFSGEFTGDFKESRKFEFRPQNGRSFQGKVGPMVDISLIYKHRGKPLKDVVFQRTTVGEGMPHYALLEALRWPGEGDQETLLP